MKSWSYVLRRLAILVPQVLGVSTAVFIVVRLLPGNPAYLIAGPMASQDSIRAVTRQMGLDRPIWEQYLTYLENVFLHADLGRSWLTSQSVTRDILQRFPATLELITAAMILAFFIAVPLGIMTALRPRGIADRFSFVYSLLAGSMPDFWWGLMLVFVLFGQLHIVPAPIGRIDLALSPPPHVTGMFTIDSLLAGDLEAFRSSLARLALPAFTLAFVYAGPTLRMTRSTMASVLQGRFIMYAKASGLPSHMVTRYALRNALLPVITMAGITYGYLISGAVLVEQVFSWGGLGQYVVQAITSSDYMAVSGVVLAATIFSLIVYLIVDLAYLAVDPRIRY